MIKYHLTNDGPKNCAIISFQPHNVCNFTCDYCHESSNGGNLRWNENYKAVADFVNKVREKNGHVYLEILGGEPTLWPQLQNFMNEIYHENLIVEINSNGSRTLRYWEAFKPGKNIVNFSWHSKEVDTAHLVRVAEVMKSKAYVFVTFLMTPENFEYGKEAIKLFENKGIELDVKPTRRSIISSELYPFTDEQLAFIKNYKQDWSAIHVPEWRDKLYPKNIVVNNEVKKWRNIVIAKENTYTGWKCSAGVDRFTLDATGDVKRCYHSVGGIIGNVYKGFDLPDDPIVCTYAHPCHCKLDAMVEKWSPNE
jgi:MoaA/NifB/PqqE/SkfB family radical SAM enzyme